MNLPRPNPIQYNVLVAEIEKGQVKIPQFQRDFVWNMRKSAELMDSIIKGYPIGTFIFWKTKERLRTVKNIGDINLPEPPEGDFVDFVLDGQQRITSIFASLKGAKIEREYGEEDFSEIYVDLEADLEGNVVIIDIEDKDRESLIKLTDLVSGGFQKLATYPKKYHDKIELYQEIIRSYLFSVISISQVPIDVATEIFTRINTSGKELTVFEIMCAKTFEPTRRFDLYEKYEELKDRLFSVDYETISNANVLRVISILLKKECKRKVILNLDKTEFIEKWDDAVNAIERAIDYFRSVYRIPVSRLLPYNDLIVPFAYFFYHHKDKPVGVKQRYLEDFFWRCSLSERYSSAVESKLAQDIKRIDFILEEKLPTYDYDVNQTPEFIRKNGRFSIGRSYVKAILCIYAYHQPKSFSDNSLVVINNDWLKAAHSKNYHHFFPKAYLKKEGREEDMNNVLNITIVDDYLNKRQIKSKDPNTYISEFKKTNQDIVNTMKTHLINDFEKFGIWNNDYESFIKERAKAVSEEIKKRIIPQSEDDYSF